MSPYQIELLRFYQDDAPNRRYHGVNHILDLLQLFWTNDVPGLAPVIITRDDRGSFPNSCSGLAQIATQPHLIEAAIYGHDIVYDTNRKDNEAVSANITASIMDKHGFQFLDADKVDFMIRASKDHIVPDPEMGDPLYKADLALFLSMDLAQLGATWEVFNKNTDDIRFEYRQYDDEQWRAGRRVFFETMLAKTTIFPHAACERTWGDQARSNMERGLKLLNS